MTTTLLRRRWLTTFAFAFALPAVMILALTAPAVALAATATTADAVSYPKPVAADWVAKDFHFRSGEIAARLKLHYTTIGAPTGEPVLILHGTGGSGTGLLTQEFAGELFGPGKPLDASRYYVILPDSIGHGASAKPSDGLRASFPKYDYDDMVDAQYRLVTEGLGIRHLRMVLGMSMGGMHTWIWGVSHPEFMDVLVPMSSQPSPMASRNWMMRRLIIDTIRNDPQWNNGNYTEQPRSVKAATVFFGIATNGGTLAYQKAAPTRAAADKLLDARLAAPFTSDANDLLYQWEASRDYDPSAGLERIQAALLAVNSADDERNPPETGIMERELKRVKHGRLLLIPASADTRGHGTVGEARRWKDSVGELLQQTPTGQP